MSFRSVGCTLALIAALASTPLRAAGGDDKQFTIAVIPDTQFYTDFLHQTEAGFPFDAREMLYDQMAYIAANARSHGGDIAFATMVGDVWQHPTERMDAAHRAGGFGQVPNALLDDPDLAPDPRTRTIEMPIAHRAFDILSGKLPFSVVPGNHDYDANWSDARFPPAPDPWHPGGHPLPFGMLAYSGLTNFTSVFGANTPFFKGRDWYVSSYRGGADSAQVFTAGGYRFLHLGLEMAPTDDVIAWAGKVVRAHPGIPTIVTIHDHLNRNGERKAIPSVDFKAVDPAHNNPQDLWDKFITSNDQIFLVLSGHQYGQSHRTDANASGHKVYQVLADYQDRRQTFLTVAPARAKEHVGIGDGWMRLMQFDLSKPVPNIRVRTYSTHYKSTSSQLPTYAAFYKAAEKPKLDDSGFLAEDEFTIPLDDFRARFGSGGKVRR
jgi:hypothetical protein